MSAKSEFSTRVENATTNSSYGEGFGDSDDEDASSESSVFEGIPKDYWFGTKYFEYVIAQELLRHTRPYENVAVIDSKLAAAIRYFPFAETLRELRSRGLGKFVGDFDEEDMDPYRAVMTSIGAIVRTGDPKQRAILVAVFRHFIPHSRDPKNHDDRHTPKSPKYSTNTPFEPMSTDDISEKELGERASALQEYGSRNGFLPTYVVSKLSSAPPEFKATVSFNGLSFEGIASRKKLARHQAAHQACKYLKM